MKELINNVNKFSNPSELRITDMKFADIVGAPMDCTLMKIETNQGIVGFGEIRDFSSKTYALILKSRIMGENPCDIDRIFRKIKQFGGHARQGGEVSGIEVALWDLAGKAYGVPVYQMLGGKFRNGIRMYCDTDVEGKHSGTDMGKALKKRMEKGFTFLKMDLGIELLIDIEGALSAPLGTLDQLRQFTQQELSYGIMDDKYADLFNVPHPFKGIQITEKGLDILEKYVADVRSEIGYEIPLAVDHVGHVLVESCIKLAKRIEKYNIAWMEDAIPWYFTNQYEKLSQQCNIPICTGEDIYLKENFKPLLENRAVSVIHPDVLTAGGIMETKKIGDMAEEYGVSMAIHMAESPIACMAAVHCAAATNNVLALEFHSNDIPWWNDLVMGLPKPLVKDGYINVLDKPGLGIDDLNDEVIKEHLDSRRPGLWEDTSSWNNEFAHDRIWS